MIFNPQVTAYIKKMAHTLRAREADMLRGKPDLLSALDHQSDIELVTRWAWTSAIVGALISFVGIPLVLNIFDHIVPLIIYQFLWLLLKLSMLFVLLMFGAAVWLTLKPPQME